GDLLQRLEGQRHHRVRVARRCPDLIESAQLLIDECPQRRGVTHWCDAADRLPRRLPHDGCWCPLHVVCSEGCRDHGEVCSLSSASHNEKRNPISEKHQAVGDCCHIAADGRSGIRGGACGIRKYADLRLDASGLQGLFDDATAFGEGDALAHLLTVAIPWNGSLHHQVICAVLSGRCGC